MFAMCAFNSLLLHFSTHTRHMGNIFLLTLRDFLSDSCADTIQTASFNNYTFCIFIRLKLISTTVSSQTETASECYCCDYIYNRSFPFFLKQRSTLTDDIYKIHIY